MIISSKNNANYKDLLALTTNRGRKKSEQFIIEGKRELSRALKANISILSFIFSESATKNKMIADSFSPHFSQAMILSDDLFKKLSIRENPDGVMGIAKTWSSDLSQCKLDPNGLYLLVEGLEKPGNLGALMRSAEATHVNAFFIANPVVTIFNPNVIRASQGAVFNLKTYWDTSDNLLQFFKNTDLQIIATTPHTNLVYWDCDMKKGSVICVGSEAFGLSATWLESATQVIIPMYGQSADSLNANISGTLCLYEARRQRHHYEF